MVDAGRTSMGCKNHAQKKEKIRNMEMECRKNIAKQE